MEIDGTSSTSNDSNNATFSSNLNYYNENLFFTTNGKLDSYFTSEKSVKRSVESDKVIRKIDYFKKDFINKTKLDDSGVKRSSIFLDNNNYERKIELNVDTRKNIIEFYNKRNMDNNSIQLQNADTFGKKSIGFSPDQVFIKI